MGRRLKFVIFGGRAVFMAVVTVAVLWLLGMQEKTARQAAPRFAAPLVHDDPGAAPAGAGRCVTGVRAHFGPVTSASVIGARNEHISSGDSADTGSFFVAELLLHSERGPAVIELEFDNDALGGERVGGASNSNPATSPISRRRTASGSRPPTRRAAADRPTRSRSARPTHPRSRPRHRPPRSRRCRPAGALARADRRCSCVVSSAPAATWRSCSSAPARSQVRVTGSGARMLLRIGLFWIQASSTLAARSPSRSPCRRSNRGPRARSRPIRAPLSS